MLLGQGKNEVLYGTVYANIYYNNMTLYLDQTVAHIYIYSIILHVADQYKHDMWPITLFLMLHKHKQ